MACGAFSGLCSSLAGGLIMASGIPLANTMGIAVSSLINSGITRWYTKKSTSLSISLGIASYDFTNEKWNFLGKEGNTVWQNIGYAIGGLGNFSDLLIGLNPKKVDLVTEHSDGMGHSAIVKEGTFTQSKQGDDVNSLISFGPNSDSTHKKNSFHWMKGTNAWPTHSSYEDIIWRNSLFVNHRTIKSYSNYLNTHPINYSLEISSCVTHTSLALNLSGLFNIGIHPYLLNFQMYLWANGLRSWLYAPFLETL